METMTSLALLCVLLYFTTVLPVSATQTITPTPTTITKKIDAHSMGAITRALESFNSHVLNQPRFAPFDMSVQIGILPIGSMSTIYRPVGDTTLSSFWYLNVTSSVVLPANIRYILPSTFSHLKVIYTEPQHEKVPENNFTCPEGLSAFQTVEGWLACGSKQFGEPSHYQARESRNYFKIDYPEVDFVGINRLRQVLESDSFFKDITLIPSENKEIDYCLHVVLRESDPSVNYPAVYNNARVFYSFTDVHVMCLLGTECIDGTWVECGDVCDNEELSELMF